MPTITLHTLGCKLNHAETSTIGREFAERGYTVVDEGTPADVILINTCTVTERADRECRQIIRRALRSGGAPFVIVTGCYAQLEPERIASIDGVDLVLGTREKFDPFRYADSFTKGNRTAVHVAPTSDEDDFGPAFTGGPGEQTRAFLKVQDGCDYTCSFCTIPLARGGSRSQSIPATVAQARLLVREGFREIILTGVNVGEYGKKEGDSLLHLVRALEDVEGCNRVRISSIEPNLLTHDLINLARPGGILCDHFHIPLQSGSDAVLRMMRRRYTTSDYRRLVEMVRRELPDAGIGVDVIVGFPGETDADFEETHRFLREIPIAYLHVFTYSERTNTPAAAMGNQVPLDVRRRRNAILRMLSQMKRRAFYESMIGRHLDILMEPEVEHGVRQGFSRNYVRVALPADACQPNAVVTAELIAADDAACLGRVIGGGTPA